MQTILKRLFAENVGPIWPSAWGWLGLYPLLTGIVGSCPIFSMLGIDRHRKLSA